MRLALEGSYEDGLQGAATEEDEETREDRRALISLTRDLIYQRDDLHYFIPARQLSQKMKDLPIQSEESIQTKQRRKCLLANMQKVMNARERNKYLSLKNQNQQTTNASNGAQTKIVASSFPGSRK